jgi:hypothetical protein
MGNWLEFCTIAINALFNVSATQSMSANEIVRIRKRVAYFAHPGDDHEVPSWSTRIRAKNHLSTIVQKSLPFWKGKGAGDGWGSVRLRLREREVPVADVVTDDVSSGSMRSEGVVVPPVPVLSGSYSSSSAPCRSRRWECSDANRRCTVKSEYQIRVEHIHSPIERSGPHLHARGPFDLTLRNGLPNCM